MMNDQVNENQNSINESIESPRPAQEQFADEPKSHCSLCGLEMSGGLWTNGDGYGDAKHVGIEIPEMNGFCWECVRTRGSEIPDFTATIDKAFAERGFCGFLEAWVGRCRNPKPCAKHATQVCSSCGDRATQNCSQTGRFVCGAPLCDNCEHTIFPNGTNGGVGFNAQDLPDGMKRHCRKDAQRFAPWYASDTAPANKRDSLES